MRDHTKLRAFELADEVAVLIYRTTKKFPKEEIYGLTSQIRRAAVSVPSNIVEGCVRSTETEYLRFLEIAFGSLRELHYQVALSCRLGYSTVTEIQSVEEKIVETEKVLNGLIRSLRTPNSLRSMPIDAVIFDIGNVLLTFDYFIAERALVAHTGIDAPPSVEELHPHRIDHETGRSTREDFVRIVREAFTHDGPEDHFMEIWTRIFQVNTPMVEWARSMHGKVPLYLLSNIGCIHHDHIFQEYDFFGTLFDDGVYSYKAGVMKPERRIFEIARTQFGVDPSRTLYIDDLEENVRGAESVGFLGHHYDPAQHHRFEECLRELRAGSGE